MNFMTRGTRISGYGRIPLYPLLERLANSMIKIGVRDEPPKSANQTRREQLALLPANRKKMRY